MAIDLAPDTNTPVGRRAPDVRAGRLLPIVVIAPAVALVGRWLTGVDVLSVAVVLGAAAGTAALVGLPMLAWAIEHRRARFVPLVALGALAGAVPMLIALVCGVAGLAARTGLDEVRDYLPYGAPLPWFGVLLWRNVAAFEAYTIAVGIVSAAVYWLVVIRLAHRGVARR
jgi:hypothetical protein